MIYAIIKALLSGIIVSVVSETAKRNPSFGALIASLPIISVLGMIWLWQRYKRQRTNSRPRTINLLDGHSVPSNVSDTSRPSARGDAFLSSPGPFMPFDNHFLFSDDLGNEEVWNRLLAIKYKSKNIHPFLYAKGE
jgi:hypothetical protein